MTGEYFGYKQRVVDKAQFAHFPIDKIFNIALEENYKKDELLKRLKYIEDKNEEELKEIENQ